LTSLQILASKGFNGAGIGGSGTTAATPFISGSAEERWIRCNSPWTQMTLAEIIGL
jgi:hypothetical protein